MSNARDKANIPALNFSSTGIDDNATSTAITIDSSENVGIGNTNPADFSGAGGQNLVIGSGSGAEGMTIYSGTTSDGVIGFADGSSGTDDYRGFLIYKHNGDAFQFGTFSTERMRLNSTGLGIGTSSPSQKLEVSSSTTTLIKSKTTAGAGIGGFEAWNNGSAYIKMYSYGTAYSGTTFGGVANANLSLLEAQGASNVVFSTWSNAGGSNPDFIFAPQRSQKVIIKSDGKVGIGTSSPTNTLTIQGAQGYASSASSLLTSTTKAATRIQGSNDASTSIWVGVETSNANPYMQVSNVNGTSSDPLLLQPFGGNVGIGTSSASAKLHVDTSNSGVTPSTNGDELFVENSANSGITIGSGTSGVGSIFFGDSGNNASGFFKYLHNGDTLTVGTGASERMRIDSSGSLLVKKTSSGFNTAGFEVKSGDEPIYVTTENNTAILVNRRSSDGDLVRFYRSTSQKGSITVSGETVSYNAFTGSHWSRFTDNSKPTILRGTVLETLDEMLDWYNLEYNITTTTKDEDGNDVTNTETFGVPHVLTDSQSVGDTITYNHNGTDVQATIVKEADVKHMMSKVSDTTDAKNVYGVFNCYDEEQSEEGYNDFLVASVGSFLVRIKGNEIIAKGDLLQSNGDGTAKVQTDDAVRSSSFAKVLSTTIIETYEDGSYLVPCSLMC